MSRLAAAAAADGYYWALARRYYEDKCAVRDGDEPREFDTGAASFSQLEEQLTGNGFFHSLQVRH